MPLQAYRTTLAEIAGHKWGRRQIRTLVLRGEEGDYFSYLRLHAVRAMHWDREVWLGGIAALLTPETLRGKGHATRLLTLTLELLAQEGVDGAYLFSDIDPCFYERLGFGIVGRAGASIPLDRLPPPAGPAGGVRTLRAEDWPAIRTIHARAAAGQALWLLRDAEQWDFLLGRRPPGAGPAAGGSQAPSGWVVERDGRVAAYALARLAGEGAELLEFGMDRGDEGGPDLDLTLGALRGAAEASGCRRLCAPWPPGRMSRFFEGRFSPEERRDRIFMVASLGPRLDLRSLIDEERGYWETDRI